MKEMVTLSQTQLKRMLVLQQVLEGQISTFEAALVLGLSERQVYRLKAKFQSQGPAALVHGNRGRKPVHAVPGETRQQVIQLAQTDRKKVKTILLLSHQTFLLQHGRNQAPVLQFVLWDYSLHKLFAL